MKQYKAVFFDWDGTAVINRKADAGKVIAAMKKLIQKKIYLIVVSGTTYENICGGRMQTYFTQEELSYLYLGLGRGNYNYGFGDDKTLFPLCDNTPAETELIRLHEACFSLHLELLTKHGFPTDIVFSRPNYCKIDLMVDHARTENELFLQENEIEKMEYLLQKHKVDGGLLGLLSMAEEAGKKVGISVKSTTDAKYLEVGYTTKSDNVAWFMKYLGKKGITLLDCCFWGDEFGEIAPGIWGSDSQMIIPETENGAFYSVSDMEILLPPQVKKVGGGVEGFLNFLEKLGKEVENAS